MAIFLIVVLIPFLVKKFHFANEDYIEFISLIFMLSLGFITHHLYRKEVASYEKQIIGLKESSKAKEEILEDNFRYIGSLNIRMQEMESALTRIKKYPETKKEMKAILQYMADKILTIVTAEWVLIRIVDTKKLQTLSEISLFRNNVKPKAINISNNNLVNDLKADSVQVISATEENFFINTYCVIPAKIDKEQKIMIETIANQIDMLYIIFASTYYKEKDLNNKKN